MADYIQALVIIYKMRSFWGVCLTNTVISAKRARPAGGGRLQRGPGGRRPGHLQGGPGFRPVLEGHRRPRRGARAVRRVSRGSGGVGEVCIGVGTHKLLDEAPTKAYKANPQNIRQSPNILDKAPTQSY